MLYIGSEVHLKLSTNKTDYGKYPPLFTDTEANECFSIYS